MKNKYKQLFFTLGEKVLKEKDIIGIFDLDTSTIKKTTLNFLKRLEKEQTSTTTNTSLPRSFVLLEDNGKEELTYHTKTPQAILKDQKEKEG